MSSTQENKQSEPKPHRQLFKGIVVSDKMHKTRVVEVQRSRTHSLYHKKLHRNSRIFVHDEKNASRQGDTVIAISTRPLSRHKHFRLLRVVNKRVEE